jgi:hypothetical protein
MQGRGEKKIYQNVIIVPDLLMLGWSFVKMLSMKEYELFCIRGDLCNCGNKTI